MICCALSNKDSRTLRTYACSASGPRHSSTSPTWSASRMSGSTSACALSVSISTARLDWTIFWSARRLRQADIGGHLVVGGVDCGQRGFDFRRRIDAGDQRGIEHDAVARGGRLHSWSMCSLMSRRFLRRSLMEMPCTAAASGLPVGHRAHRRRLEVGDALAQNGDEISHDMGDRVFHAEQIGVQVALGDAVADLPGQPGFSWSLVTASSMVPSLFAAGSSGSYAMFTVSWRWTPCTRVSHGHLKYGPPGGMTRTCG